MVKITRENMTKAARNAKHVRIQILDLNERRFLAYSQSNSNETYEVRLVIAPNGLRLGECDCVGFERVGYCKHLAACVGLLRGIQQARAAAEQSAERNRGCSADEAGGVIRPPSPAITSELATPDPVVASPEPDAVREDPASGSTPDYPIEEAHNLETFCSVCGRETGGGRCDVDSNAEILTREELDDRDREARRELFQRLLDGLVADDDRPARPGTLRAEMEAAVLVKQPQREVKIDGWGI